MLKDFHQDNVSSVFESVFHTGHFYRGIRSQDVMEIRAGKEKAAMSGIG